MTALIVATISIGYLAGWFLWARWCMNSAYQEWKVKSASLHRERYEWYGLKPTDWPESQQRKEGIRVGFGGGIVWPLIALVALVVLGSPAMFRRIEHLFIPEKRCDEQRLAEADEMMRNADTWAKLAHDLRESEPTIAEAVQSAATSSRDRAVELRKAAGR